MEEFYIFLMMVGSLGFGVSVTGFVYENYVIPNRFKNRIKNGS